MVLNKRGLVFFYRLMLGTIIILLGIAFAFPTQSVINESRTNLTCSAPSSDFDQATCWILDITKPLFAGGIILLGFAVLLKIV